MIYVLAGNHNQFKEYVREQSKDPRGYKYIGRREALYGVRNVEVVKVGTWNRRDDIAEILADIKQRNVEL
jgi:hypothetical protein